MKDGSKVDGILMRGVAGGRARCGVGGYPRSGPVLQPRVARPLRGQWSGWGVIMASAAGPLGGLRSCSAPLLAALSHYCVCLGKISNVKALQHPEHAVKGDAAEGTAGKRDRD